MKKLLLILSSGVAITSAYADTNLDPSLVPLTAGIAESFLRSAMRVGCDKLGLQKTSEIVSTLGASIVTRVIGTKIAQDYFDMRDKPLFKTGMLAAIHSYSQLLTSLIRDKSLKRDALASGVPFLLLNYRGAINSIAIPGVVFNVVIDKHIPVAAKARSCISWMYYTNSARSIIDPEWIAV